MQKSYPRGIPPKKSLGQNFLVDADAAARIIEAAALSPEDTVVEIGPGRGVLTVSLAERAGRVIAIELDERLFEMLKEEHKGRANLDIVCADAMKFPFEELEGPVKVVANLPYYISTPIITRLIEARGIVGMMVLMLQKEVAGRITAPPGGKDYGYMSVMVQLYTRPEVLFDVPRGAFRPVPKVDSSVLRMTVRESPAVPCRDYGLMRRLVSAAFMQRRKTLKNALKASRIFTDEGLEGIEGIGIDPMRRAETLTLAEFAGLTDFLFEFQMPT